MRDVFFTFRFFIYGLIAGSFAGSATSSFGVESNIVELIFIAVSLVAIVLFDKKYIRG
jgi:hypothetical protein